MAFVVGSISSFIPSSSSNSFTASRIPNYLISNNKPLLIKSAVKRDRPKSSSGGGAQINRVPRSGLLLRTFDVRAERITSNNFSSTDPNKTRSILDDDDATILKLESTHDN